MTLGQVYYALNTAVNQFLKSNGITARLYAFGINPQQQKAKADKATYPYFQSRFPTNVDRPPHTTRDSAIITWFDYQLDFYAAPENSQYNAAEMLEVFEKVMNAIQDTRIQIWRDIASLQKITGPIDTTYEGGSVKISLTTIFRLAAVCSYTLDITPYVESSIDSVMDVIDGALSGEYD